MRIRKVGVVGAGSMGSGIAALAASAGIPVVMLDIPGKDDRSGVARGALQRALKARPAPFMHPSRAAAITVGNTEDHLELLADCDWIVEAIVEQVARKRELFARLAAIMSPTAILSSNTSGIPIATLAEGMAPDLRARFLGTHFFNPPRYLHLLEVIPTPDTSAETLDAIRTFGSRSFGKGIVIAHDVPGFIANRLGMYGMTRVLRLMEQFDLTIDEVDTLTGPFIGRPKSATFRTGDISGLDVIAHVAAGLSATTGEDFSIPEWTRALVAAGRFGEKTGAGFYKKVGKEIHTLDWKTGEYRPQAKVDLGELAPLAALPLPERLHALTTAQGKYADFLRALFLDLSRYTLEKAPQLANDIVSIDRAMEWGYGWDLGPFAQMDAFGIDNLRAELTKNGAPVPELLGSARDGFYRITNTGVRALGLDGEYAPLPEVSDEISLASLRRRTNTIEQSNDAAVHDLGDGVLLIEFRTKMNTLGEGVLRMLDAALQRVEAGRYVGLVIGNDDPRTFTAGADLASVMRGIAANDWKGLEAGVRDFQNAVMSIRRAPFPVVVAPFGLTLGGGVEFALHAARVQAHAELYMGLVEVGVGLLPGGGGTKELLFRFTQELAAYEEADPFEAPKRAFKLISMGATSTSALEAKAMGYLQRGDRISMNRAHLLADAKQRVLDLAPDHVAPFPQTIRALGKEALGNLEYGIFAMHEGRYITDHEVRIGRKIAYVLSGGDGPPRDVTEQDVLDLEREAFLELLGTKETQERIVHTLKTGKPLRN
jgi:3-hydroxyacyl-CoA dehydrogenase